MIATSPRDILSFAVEKGKAHRRSVIVTLAGIEGSSSRAIGTQMAVCEDGSSIGSFSGGCIEAAVCAEALMVMKQGLGRTVRYGSGSPYIDIRLPCGGGIDLLFTPLPGLDAVHDALARLDRRMPAAIAFDLQSAASGAVADEQREDRIVVYYAPALRIIAIGQGDDLTAFARLGSRFGADILAMTPDGPVMAALAHEGIDTLPLRLRNQLPDCDSDPWTAIIFLFHDHDWEEALLPQALAKPAFYHGAIGSPRTHRARLSALADAGVLQSDIDQLRGMIGVIPATRDPATLALSILGEVVAEYRLAASPVQPIADRSLAIAGKC